MASAAGTPRAFAISLVLVLAWAATGPMFHYSDSWQLVVNTRTTVLRFLMMLFIQHIQNRDSAAAHAKLDELIRATAEPLTKKPTLAGELPSSKTETQSQISRSGS
jgi:low affinity Fe/Cu permease